MRRPLVLTILSTLALVAAGCGDDLPAGNDDTATGSGTAAGTASTGLDTTEGADESSSTGEPEVPWDGTWPTLECDPLVPEFCGFPFPNNVFTVVDSDAETGLRVDLSAEMMPMAANGVVTQRDVFNTRDGFSPGIGLLAFLPGASVDGLARPNSIDLSLAPDSPTVLLDTETGERVAHWAELDMTTDDATRRSFMIRPAARLEDNRRYIVAIRNVADDAGQTLTASPTFAALRDRTESDDKSVEARRGLYTDIFAQLDNAGVERDDLQLAWDFTTASKEDNTGWLIGMRDDALASLPPEGPSYTLDTIDMDWSEDVAIRIIGQMEVPLYLDQPGVGGVINLGADGRPEVNGTAEYPFQILVPYSALETPGTLLQFGHGLFGGHESVEGLGDFANRHNMIIFAFDWIGMSDEDVLPIGGLLSGGDLSAFETLPSRLLQSHVNAVLGMRMMMGGMVDDPIMETPVGSAINPDERYYFGGSLGGIMGSVYMAITPDVVRGGLGVPGQSFNLLLPRSVLFDPFFDILRVNYTDPRDIQMVLAAAMLLWDRAEPTGFSKYIREEGAFPNTPAHEVLIQVAIGDNQVSNYGSHIMARTIGTPLLVPSPQEVWGVEEVEAGHVGSAMIEHDFGLPPIPLDNVPMREGPDPHAAIWNYDAGIDELEHFLRSGEVISFCDGLCDPD